MSNDANIRAEVTNMYPSPRWARRVRAMSDAQVFAIWKKNKDKKEGVK